MFPKTCLVSSLVEIDKNLTKLLNFYGIEHELFNIGDITKGYCLFLNCSILKDDNSCISYVNTLLSNFSYAYFYNISPDYSDVISRITGDRVSFSSITNDKFYYEVTDLYPDINGCLGGLSFEGNKDSQNFKFNCEDETFQRLITILKGSFFIKSKRKNCELFLIAKRGVINIDKKIGLDFNMLNYFSDLIPILMFLKYVYKEWIWQENEKYACFMIDDPLLTKNYGFLNYEKLLTLMDRKKFCTNIAFIPYNYKRSKKEVVNLFNKRKDKYSISVHGCDHTEAEFSISDEKELNRKIKLADLRMNIHRERTKIKYDKVMVFPQGKFSSNCIKVLKANNYLGVINSSCFTDDNVEFKIADLMLPAVLNYFKFPIFMRRYPADIREYALDLFMGKPVFIVEHHGYFKDKYKNLSNFIDAINSLSNKIKWKSPEYILKHFYQRRKINENQYCIRMFSNNIKLKKWSRQKETVCIIKEESNASIDKISVNCDEIEYCIKDNVLRFEISMNSVDQLEIIIYYQLLLDVNKNPGFIKKNQIFLRRILTEIRDNYFSKNELALSIVSKLKIILKKVVA